MTQHTSSKGSGQSPDRHLVSRRRFLAAAPASVAAPYVLTSGALGAAGATPASDRITIGAIGVGGRGSGHVGAMAGNRSTRVLAVCDANKPKADANKKRVDRAYGESGKGCASYSDFRELATRDDIDAVFVASPEYWHVLHSIWSARGGKDVYCEKALSLTHAETVALRKTIRRYGRVFQTGTQQRSDGKFRFACELARNGYLGKLHTVEVGVPGGRSLPNVSPSPVPAGLDYEMWLGPAPWKPYNKLKCSYNWYFIYDYCIGWIGSWGVHHVDIALWGAPALATLPVEVQGTATFPTDGIANTSVTWQVEMVASNGLRFSFSDNRHHPQGCRFKGDKGWVHVNRGGIRAEPASLLKVAIKPDEEHLYVSRNHHGNFLECIRTRRDPVSDVEAGCAATNATIIADIATRMGRKITWDWKTEQFVKDDEANRMLQRAMRTPWCL